jgi:hypothetical protein
MMHSLWFLPLLHVFAATVSAQQFVELRLYPPEIQLDSARDEQRITALGITASGVTQDLSASVHWYLDGNAAEFVAGPTPHLKPGAGGFSQLVAELGNLRAEVPVRVEHATLVPPVSFQNEVLPILTRSGCNAGSCHGAAAGKNGFGLSLFAFHPAHDHFVLTRELRGRRIDPAEPEQSLILQKGAGLVPHQGGRKLPAESPLRNTVRAWIAAGAPDDAKDAAVLRGIEVMPPDAVLVRGSRLPMQLLAHYADGTDRDVTALALWSSGNDGAAGIGGDGSVQAIANGEAAMLARFGGLAVSASVLVLDADAPFVWPAVPESNFIDRAIHTKLQRARVLPADLCTDEQFVRRVTLDLLGQLPDPQQAMAFVADPSPDKRARWIDAMLQRPEFATMQAMAWAEVLRVDSDRMEAKGAALFAAWLREQFAAHRPLDAIVQEMLTSSGASFANAPVNFWLAEDQPNLLAEHISQTLLGVRVQCAQCHNHPFENWTMDDYYGFAAFCGQLGRKRGEDGEEWVLWDRGRGEVRNKRDNQTSAPRFLGGGPASIPAGTDRRSVLASWLVRQPAFARNVANRLWASLFGRGLVDPADDVRVSNPASHPQLLQQLADLLVEQHFDVRTVVAAICNSRTYQLAVRPDPARSGTTSPALFASMNVRRLPAETLLDAIARVTGVATKYPGLSLGRSATEIAQGQTHLRFLELFGRPSREGSCTCDRRPEPTLGQSLHLINGDTIAEKLAAADGLLQKALASKQPAEAMLEDLFRRAFSRASSTAEQNTLLDPVRNAKDTAAALAAWQDIYWAVLNSKEFLFQH